jgi:hypothetical protein
MAKGGYLGYNQKDETERGSEPERKKNGTMKSMKNMKGENEEWCGTFFMSFMGFMV